MMMRTWIRTTVLIVVLVVWHAGFASAEGERDYGRSGLYTGLGLGIGIQDFDLAPIDPPHKGIGGDFWLGYRFLGYFSAELQLEHLHGFEHFVRDSEDPYPVLIDFALDALTFGGNVKAYALKGPIQPWASAGVGLGWQKVTNFGVRTETTDLIARFGGGVDIYGFESEHWVLTAGASYVLGTGDLSDTRYASITAGVLYRF